MLELEPARAAHRPAEGPREPSAPSARSASSRVGKFFSTSCTEPSSSVRRWKPLPSASRRAIGVLRPGTKRLSMNTTRAPGSSTACSRASQPRSAAFGTWLHQKPAKAASKGAPAMPSSAKASARAKRTTPLGSGLVAAIASVSGLTSVASQSRLWRAPCTVHQPVPQATSSTRWPAKARVTRACRWRSSRWRSGRA
jgi:hypothetical protein